MPTKKSKDTKLFWTTLPGILTGIAGIIGAIGSLIIGLNSAGYLKPKTTATPLKKEWAIPFQQEFPAGTWAEGTYNYTINANCPGTNSSKQGPSKSFTVSRAAEILNKEIFIRYSGLYDALQSTDVKLETIHPDQKTIASYTVIAQNENDIVLKTKVCEIKFSYSFNGQPNKEINLTPTAAIPYNH